jgi:HEAT repeat protein
MRCLALAVLFVCAGSLLAQDAQPSTQTQLPTGAAPREQAAPAAPEPAQTEAPATEQKAPSSIPASAKKQSPREEAWEILTTGAQNDSTERRTKAIGALGLIPNNPRARRLAEAGLQDAAPAVRSAAANALGEMGAKESIPLLKQRLDDEDTGVVLACAKTLLQLKDNEAYDVYYAVLTGERKASGSGISQQMKILRDPKQLAQLGFEEGIGFVPFAGMGYEAYRRLSKDTVSPVRAAAAHTLANDPDPESGKALTHAASDKSWIVRQAALDALAKRNDPGLVHAAVTAMEDEKEIVMYTAAATVVHLTDPVAKPTKQKQRRTSR